MYVILEKAKPYTRVRRGKLERVSGYTGKLSDLTKLARKMGIYLTLTNWGKVWVLDNLYRETGEGVPFISSSHPLSISKPGSGAKLMKRITKAADKSNKTIVLWPSHTGSSFLKNYFKKFGFRQFKWKENREFPVNDVNWIDNKAMIRYPRTEIRD